MSLFYDDYVSRLAWNIMSRDWEQVQGILNPWQRATLLIVPEAGKKVASATVKLMAGDLEQSVYVTDILLQGGNILAGWNPAKRDSMDYIGLEMWMFVIDRDYIGQPGKVIGP